MNHSISLQHLYTKVDTLYPHSIAGQLCLTLSLHDCILYGIAPKFMQVVSVLCSQA